MEDSGCRCFPLRCNQPELASYLNDLKGSAEKKCNDKSVGKGVDDPFSIKYSPTSVRCVMIWCTQQNVYKNSEPKKVQGEVEGQQ